MTDNTTPSLRVHALHLVGKGFRVFPITPGGTHPMVKFGAESSADPDHITRTWWRSDASRKNVGVHTGDGLMVLDIDTGHGGGESIQSLLAVHGPLPDTYAVSTPSGGAHFYFTTDKDVRNSASKVGPGIDIRGHNGFVVGAGSVREQTDKKAGGVYTALNDLPPAPCPEWLEQLAMAEKAAPAGALAQTMQQQMTNVPKGARNDRLFKEACGLRGQGYSHAAILAALRGRNAADTDEPLDDSEIQLIASQAAKYTPNNPMGGQQSFKAPNTMPPDPPRSKRRHVDDEPPAPPKPFDIMRSDELYSLDLPALQYSIEPLMAEGLYLLNGRPKGGKSWLAMAMAAAVAEGVPLWDQFETNQGDVLYLALEDGHRRLRDRLAYFDNPRGIDFVTRDAATLDTGLLDQMQWWVDSRDNPRFIVIDILQRIRPVNGGGENAYTFDYNSIKPLQEWANDVGLTILVVHHTRKLQTDTNMDSVSGSQGLAGAVDGLMFLKTPNSGKTGLLSLESRDTDNGDYDLVRAAKPSGCWEFIGEHDDASDVGSTDSRILAQLAVDGPLTVNDLAQALATARSHVQTACTRMFHDGSLKREKEGRAFIYAIPDAVPASMAMANVNDMGVSNP